MLAAGPMALRMVEQKDCCSCCLTFELTGRRRWDARPGLAKMYRVPPDRAWWPAVGAPVERGVRPHLQGPSVTCQAKQAARDSGILETAAFVHSYIS